VGCVENLKEMLTPSTKEQDAAAAVALILHPVRDDFEVLLVKRVECGNDPWSGQIALPGGKRDRKDRTLHDTVVREVREEIGFNLNTCQILGVLDPLLSAPRPDMRILPFVIFCRDRPQINLNETELETYVWIPLKDLELNRGVVSFPFGDFPAYIVGVTVVWGLTYRMLEQFFELYEKCQ
jgi:8-oxo-dGTP pyrophosphatase MutT (NUDIX family)